MSSRILEQLEDLLMQGTTYHGSQHLDDAGMLQKAVDCSACGSGDPRADLYLLQSKPDVLLEKCQRCGIASASRMPTDDALAQYYSHYYEATDDQVTFADPDRFARRLEKSIGPVCRTPRILDFGGGDGGLSIALAHRFIARPDVDSCSVHIVDYASPRESESDQIAISSSTTLEASAPEFDVVLASASLEHVPAIGNTMRDLLSRVAADGYFYARTPYLAPFARVLKNLDFTYPAHVHDVGPDFWNQAPRLFDPSMRIVHSRPSPVETALRGAPLRTAAAWAFKMPGVIESWLRPAGSKIRYRLVGGWEVLFQRYETSSPLEEGESNAQR